MYKLIKGTMINLLLCGDFCVPGVRLCGSPAFKSRPANCEIKRKNIDLKQEIYHRHLKKVNSILLSNQLAKPREHL
jgi:hypothetical protein